MRRKIISAILLFVFLSCGVDRAMGYFQDMGAGARAEGMGGAFTAIADDAYATYYNPAGLAQLTQAQASVAYAQLLTGLSDGSNLGLSQLTYAQPLEGGKQGTLALGYQRFGLDQIYNEQSFYLSYGRKILDFNSGAELMLGANAIYLAHGFQPGAEATNSCQGFNCSFGIDPVLSGRNTESTPDADFSLLYRSPDHIQAGLMVQHLLMPNVAFGGTDRLPLNIHAGVAYTALWMNLSAELDSDQLADGTQGQDFILAAERFFPTLDWGEFALRGSLGYGSENWKQITVGASYIINKIEFDYAFLMPIGGIATTAGTQRLDILFRFGKSDPQEELTADLMDKARKIRDGLIPVGLNLGPANRPHDLTDPRLVNVRNLVEHGRFEAAHEEMKALMRNLPADPSFSILLDRLELIAEFYPEFSIGSERWSTTMFTGFQDFLKGEDRFAMLHVSYAAGLNPEDLRIERILSKLETVTQIKANKVSPNNTLGFIGQLLYQAEAANDSREYMRVRQILDDIIELEPNNPIALERLGTVDYLLGKNKEAVVAWGKALQTETNPEEIDSLKNYLELAKEKVRASKAGGAGTLQATKGKSQVLPQAAPKIQTPVLGKIKALNSRDRKEITRLYQRGVKDYASGDYIHATAAFLRILEIDPNNAEAKKALERMNQSQGNR
jgi:tetratricopeptide (TPR) repeat protein